MRILLACLFSALVLPAQSLSLTFDDGPKVAQKVRLDARGKNEAILAALREAKLQSCLFVTGACLSTEEGRALVEAWGKAGHLIGNHGSAHGSLNTRNHTLDWFKADFLEEDRRIQGFPGYTRWFRFPYLKEGDTPEKRDGVRSFLKAQGYANGHVTIDASDWFYDARLQEALARDPGLDLAPWRKAYLDHLWDRAAYYDGLAREVLGRPIPHVMLLHHNLTSALFLGDLIRLFRSRGWQVLSPQEAYRDPVYRMEPEGMPAGESLVWSLARAKGHKGLRHPGEDGAYEEPKLKALGL